MVLKLGASEGHERGANVGFVTNNAARKRLLQSRCHESGQARLNCGRVYLSNTAIASISTMKSGCDRRRTSTVVLVGSDCPNIS
jgi:hypothetical protein